MYKPFRPTMVVGREVPKGATEQCRSGSLAASGGGHNCRGHCGGAIVVIKKEEKARTVPLACLKKTRFELLNSFYRFRKLVAWRVAGRTNLPSDILCS